MKHISSKKTGEESNGIPPSGSCHGHTRQLNGPFNRLPIHHLGRFLPSVFGQLVSLFAITNLLVRKVFP